MNDFGPESRETRSARRAADAASLSKSRFLAMMSHELRTPLNAVIGFSDAIGQAAADHATALDRARLAEFSLEIHEAGEHLLAFVNNILDVARIESGNFDLADDLIDVLHLAEDCIRGLAPAARAADISLDLALDPDTPWLRGDERQLRQALGHLLGNAVKFTPAGGHIVFSAEMEQDGRLALMVRDSGIGIPPEDTERVFEPFSQLDNGLARRATGAGIGLYFCRAVLVAHGGTVHLQSAEGRGTTARVTLPASRLRALPGTPDPTMRSFGDAG